VPCVGIEGELQTLIPLQTPDLFQIVAELTLEQAVNCRGDRERHVGFLVRA